MSATQRRSIRWFLGLVIGALFVWLSLRKFPIGDAVSHALHLVGANLIGGDLHGLSPQAIAENPGLLPKDAWMVHLPLILPYLAILVVIHFIRVWRWDPLLRRIGHNVPFRVLNESGGISFMAVFLMPVRLGEFVRPALLKRQAGVRMSTSMALVILERIIDGLVVTAFLFILLWLLPEQNEVAYTRIYTGTVISLLVFGGGLITIVLAYLFQDAAHRLLQATLGRISTNLTRRGSGILERFYGGLACIPDVRTMVLFCGVTVLYWGINGLGYYAMLRAFHMDLGLAAGYAMMAAVVIGMMIPNPPGNVGTFWFFLLLPLSLYGDIATTQHIMLALFVWFVQMGQMTIFGLYFLGRAQLTLRDLDVDAEPEPPAPVTDRLVTTDA